MISVKDLNPKGYPIKEGSAIEKNLQILFQRLMELQEAFENALVVTSGLRSDEQQMELIAQGKSNALHSKHLAGAAADIADPDGLLADWCLTNQKSLEVIGLWMEHPNHTPGWVHLQMMAPRSGRRIFIP